MFRSRYYSTRTILLGHSRRVARGDIVMMLLFKVGCWRHLQQHVCCYSGQIVNYELALTRSLLLEALQTQFELNFADQSVTDGIHVHR